MLGKNVGKRKERIKHERKKLAALASKPLGVSEEVSLSDNEIVEWAVAKAATYRYWNDYSLYKYPRELGWEMRRALHFFMLAATNVLYPKELCYDVQCPNSAFFDLFQTNEAFFHCFVGIAEGMRCIIMGMDGVTELVLRSLANTYRCINSELTTSNELSWGTIASVMSLVMHENLFGMVGKSKLHLQALERMVELKGGLSAFEPRIALLHKICRSDIEYTLQTGTPPRFFRDKWPRAEFNEELLKADIYPTASLDLEDAIIKEVFEDYTDVSLILNTEAIDPSQILIDGRIKPRLRGASFQEILISIIYRLLHAYPLNGVRPLSNIDNTCYLATLALMTTMMTRGSPKHHQYFTLLRQRLLNTLDQLEHKDAEFKFWV